MHVVVVSYYVCLCVCVSAAVPTREHRCLEPHREPCTEDLEERLPQLPGPASTPPRASNRQTPTTRQPGQPTTSSCTRPRLLRHRLHRHSNKEPSVSSTLVVINICTHVRKEPNFSSSLVCAIHYSKEPNFSSSLVCAIHYSKEPSVSSTLVLYTYSTVVKSSTLMLHTRTPTIKC